MIGIYFPISQGKYALVDREVYEEVILAKWHYTKQGYVGNNSLGLLHQFIYFLTNSEYVGFLDHRNRDRLDCRSENIRLATPQQNSANAIGKGIGYKGVHMIYGKYPTARITVNGKSIHLGGYETIEEAANAYDSAAIVFFGEFANLNCAWLRKGEGECQYHVELESDIEEDIITQTRFVGLSYRWLM